MEGAFEAHPPGYWGLIKNQFVCKKEHTQLNMNTNEPEIMFQNPDKPLFGIIDWLLNVFPHMF